MRVVLDTNVIVPGLLNPHGAPGRVIDLVLDGRLVPLYDDRILDEYRNVLLRPEFAFHPRDVETFIDYVRTQGQQVGAGPLAVTLPDEDDLPFLEVAASGAAQALVTGNRRHFVPKKGSHQVPVYTPDRLLSALAI